VALSIVVPLLGRPAEASPAAQVPCEFTLGFKTLRDMIVAQYGDIVGNCLENEWHNAFNGDALQQTTGGLMVWRKADNWTAFTNGSTTWLNGPFGLATRPNAGPFFSWEGPPPAAQPGGPLPAEQPPAAEPTATPVPQPGKPSVRLELDDDRVDQGEEFRVTVEGSDSVGVDAVWWWASDTDDDELRDTHRYNCQGANPCRRSWTQSTQDDGRITFHAKARNSAGVESDEVTIELRVREVTPTPTPTATPAP